VHSKEKLEIAPRTNHFVIIGAGAVQDSGSLLRKASDGQAEFLAKFLFFWDMKNQ